MSSSHFPLKATVFSFREGLFQQQEVGSSQESATKKTDRRSICKSESFWRSEIDKEIAQIRETTM